MMVISRDVGRELCPSDAALKDRERREKKASCQGLLAVCGAC